MRRGPRACAGVFGGTLLLLTGSPSPADASPQSRELTREGFRSAYALDFTERAARAACRPDDGARARTTAGSSGSCADSGYVPLAVSTLSWPKRVLANAVGMPGDRDCGIELLELAASPEADTATDASLVLSVVYNRERRYPAAMRHLDLLRARGPAARADERAPRLDPRAHAPGAGEARARRRRHARGDGPPRCGRAVRATGRRPRACRRRKASGHWIRTCSRRPCRVAMRTARSGREDVLHAGKRDAGCPAGLGGSDHMTIGSGTSSNVPGT